MSLDPTESFSSAGALGGIGPISNINLSQQFGSVAGVALPEHQKPGINGPENYQVAQSYPDGSHSRIGYHPGNGKVFPQASGANGGGLMVDVAPDRNGVISSHGILQIGPPGLGR